MIIKEHKILETGLHCLIDDKGRVEVYTEEEYETISIIEKLFHKVKSKYLSHE